MERMPERRFSAIRACDARLLCKKMFIKQFEETAVSSNLLPMKV
jgi:hypothetical protein